MELKTFIFIGPSGAGKGTQGNILVQYLQDIEKNKPVFYMETGSKFREFVTFDNYSSKKALEILNEGKRQPDFLAVYLWASIFIDKLKGSEFVVIDGTPRSVNEAVMLDTALRFYGNSKPYVIYLNTSNEECRKRLLSRGRNDDTEDAIKKRLDWFEKDVIPAVLFYKNNQDYNFLEIDGNKTVEEISQLIKAEIK